MKYFLLSLGLFSHFLLAEPKNVKTSNGRFQLIQLSESRRDQYLLDTETGAIWQSGCEIPDQSDPLGCKYSIWLQQDVIGLNTTLNKALEKIKHLQESH